MRKIKMLFLDTTSNGKKDKEGRFCDVLELNVKTNMMSNHRKGRNMW